MTLETSVLSLLVPDTIGTHQSYRTGNIKDNRVDEEHCWDTRSFSNILLDEVFTSL